MQARTASRQSADAAARPIKVDRNMGFYEERILPWLIHLVMRRRDLASYRARTISAASGRVLEIGIGSGLNLPLYGASAAEIIGLDPSAKLLAMAGEAGARSAMPLKLIEGSAE